ncbi:MAG: hypothetical protein J0H01_17045 [Rhizobiales bacterium]|nr:hypothetical protein [Hyphomicrobiales bacterium]
MSRGKQANPFGSWFNLAMLAAESQQVIGLRMIRLAFGGPRADAESRRMVSEKVAAATEAAGQLMLGASPDSIVQGYRTKVRANARRLQKG